MVDDHQLLSEVLSQTLLGRGVQAESLFADSLAQLLDRLLQRRPRVVLLDLDLGRLGTSTSLIGPLARAGSPGGPDDRGGRPAQHRRGAGVAARSAISRRSTVSRHCSDGRCRRCGPNRRQPCRLAQPSSCSCVPQLNENVAGRRRIPPLCVTGNCAEVIQQSALRLHRLALRLAHRTSWRTVEKSIVTQPTRDIGRLRSQVGVPSERHRQLQEGGEVFHFMIEKEVTRHSPINNRSPYDWREPVVEMPVVAGRPDFAVTHEKQAGLVERNCIGDRACDKEQSSGLGGKWIDRTCVFSVEGKSAIQASHC